MSALHAATSRVMRNKSADSTRKASEAGRALIHLSKLTESEKREFEELLNELLADGAYSPDQVLRRIKAAVDLEESHAAEYAEIEQSVEAAFRPR